MRILLPFIFLVVGCASAPTTNNTPVPSEGAFGLQLTFFGDNEEAEFSPDGKKIVYISGHRSHTNFQLYELLLSLNHERRVTFSDGDVSTPIYVENGERILYASSTDELKERPEMFYPRNSEDPPPNDLYVSDPFGVRIERLTNEPGNQSQPFLINENEFVYLSKTRGLSVLKKMNVNGGGKSIFLKKEDGNLISYVIGKNGLIFWLEKKMVFRKMPGRKSAPLTLPEREYQSLSWYDHTGDKLLLSFRQGAMSSVAVYDLSENCLSTIITADREISHPRVSLKNKKLLLSVSTSGQKQLFLMPLPDSLPTCEKISAQ
jgi:Tol biopolymer transport system component